MGTLKAVEKQENLLKWFVPPKELYQWDFTLEKFVVEDSQQDVNPDNVGTEQMRGESTSLGILFLTLSVRLAVLCIFPLAATLVVT